jgi:MFS family permease
MTTRFSYSNVIFAVRMAETFGVSYSRVANIPTLTQAGYGVICPSMIIQTAHRLRLISYATGILLITPLGDLVRRRPLLLLIMSLSATACLSLALIPSVIGFEVVSFLIGVLTVTPQIMIPFAADLAPPERRASAISIVFSGLLLGILIARVMSGIVAEFTAWEDVYYVGAGAQYFFVFILYFVLPDWPRNQPKNSKGEPIGYLGILWTMAKFAVTEPLLIQGCLIGLVSSAVFASFWTTLTFLLGGPLYNYSTFVQPFQSCWIYIPDECRFMIF